MATLKHWIWLAQVPGVGIRQKLALLHAFHSPEAVFYAPRDQRLQVPGMTPALADLLERTPAGVADPILADCDRLGLRILTIQDAAYPGRLRNIADPPLLLYVQGRMPDFDGEPALAMVGSRRASAYALEAGERLSAELADMGALIVSGLAAGADAAAHRGALRSGGFTAAVIGNGHDVLYPRECRSLYEDIAVQGVILSEYPPGTDPLPRNFPARNRIISGLSLGVVVTEAPARSGSLITAGLALEQGRDVFVVPGHLYDPHCAGGLRMLEEGAIPVAGAWSILRPYADRFPDKIHPPQLRQVPRPVPARREAAPAPIRRETGTEAAAPRPEAPVLRLDGDSGLTDDQRCIVQALDGRTMQVDDLIEAVQIPTHRVLSALTVLEVNQIVTQDSGKRFSLAVTLQ